LLAGGGEGDEKVSELSPPGDGGSGMFNSFFYLPADLIDKWL
jgi:hypothetical protein